MEVRTTSFVILSVALGLFAFLHPYAHMFSRWSSGLDSCGDPLNISGIVPFADRFSCVFFSAADEVSSGLVPSLSFESGSWTTSALVWDWSLFSSLGLPVAVFAAVEGTRSRWLGSTVSFFVLVTLAQLVTLSVAIPLLWLPFIFALSAASSNLTRKLVLPPVERINRIGLAAVILVLISAFLDWTPSSEYYYTKTILAEYVPSFLPLLWTSYSFFRKPERHSNTLIRAQASFARTAKLYNLMAVASFLEFSMKSLIPYAIKSSPIDSIPPLLSLMKSVPTKGNLVLWFLLWEGACLTTAMSLFVIHEAWILDYNPLSSVISFLARSAVIGPGASLMVFAVWREERILNRLIRIVEKASIELEERALLDSFHSAAEFSTSPSSPLQAARVEISAQKQSSSLRKRKSKAKAVFFQQQSDPKSQSRHQTPNRSTDVLVTTNTATSLYPTSTVSTTEIEIIFARPSYIERLRRITVYLILTAFLLSLSMWHLEVGYNIQYCDASSTMNSHLFPTCVPCPNQAICNQDQVIGCKIDGYSVFGEEGFGPLGSYIGLWPVCLPDSDEMVQPHLNPRIKGRTLSLRRRFEVVVMDGWLNDVWFWIVRTSVEVYHLVL